MSKYNPISEEEIERNLRNAQRTSKLTEAAFWVILFALLAIGIAMSL